jgi:hypothetical protein
LQPELGERTDDRFGVSNLLRQLAGMGRQDQFDVEGTSYPTGLREMALPLRSSPVWGAADVHVLGFSDQRTTEPGHEQSFQIVGFRAE